MKELIAQISVQNQLPRGWKKYYDEVNQMPYYYNEILKVTQWERPPATRGTPIEISPSLQVAVSNAVLRHSDI